MSDMSQTRQLGMRGCSEALTQFLAERDIVDQNQPQPEGTESVVFSGRNQQTMGRDVWLGWFWVPIGKGPTLAEEFERTPQSGGAMVKAKVDRPRRAAMA